MRAYGASSEEARYALDLLKDWLDEDLITADQYQRMERETVCEFRRTNIFLRLVLFLFTVIMVTAASALFFSVFFRHPGDETIGIFLLIFAALSNAAAEVAVGRAHLYRYGIEEALAACAVGFLCVGMQIAFFGSLFSSPKLDRPGFLVPAAGAMASLWIWHRFGLPYAPLVAMVFVAWLPAHFSASPAGQHLIVAALYSAGVAAVAALRARHRFTYLEREYSIAEALLWLGIYLAINLQLSPVNLLGLGWGYARTGTQFPAVFYWATWVLIWCLPPVMLARGLRQRDRLIIAAGAIAFILTLVTNKPYLGWERHTWDPMVLGAVLIGLALFLRRWLAKAPGGIRHGFTAQRMSRKDRGWMSAGVGAVGLAAPNIVTPGHTSVPPVRFGGGDSGGGGATSDF